MAAPTMSMLPPSLSDLSQTQLHFYITSLNATKTHVNKTINAVEEQLSQVLPLFFPSESRIAS